MGIRTNFASSIDLNHFLNKSFALPSSYDEKTNIITSDNQEIMIINYDFYEEKTNEPLYVIIKRLDPLNVKNGKHWWLIHKLYSAKQIAETFHVQINKLILPSSPRKTKKFAFEM